MSTMLVETIDKMEETLNNAAANIVNIKQLCMGDKDIERIMAEAMQLHRSLSTAMHAIDRLKGTTQYYYDQED